MSAVMHRGEFLPADQACGLDEFAPTNRPRLAVASSDWLEIEWPHASDATTSWSRTTSHLLHKVRT